MVKKTAMGKQLRIFSAMFPSSANLLGNVHGVTDELFLRQSIDMTSKNLALCEDLDVATLNCDNLVLQVEAYSANPLSTLGLSTFMTWCPPPGHI